MHLYGSHAVPVSFHCLCPQSTSPKSSKNVGLCASVECCRVIRDSGFHKLRYRCTRPHTAPLCVCAQQESPDSRPIGSCLPERGPAQRKEATSEDTPNA